MAASVAVNPGRTVSLFERHGFEWTPRIGKNRWVVTKVVRGSGL